MSKIVGEERGGARGAPWRGARGALWSGAYGAGA